MKTPQELYDLAQSCLDECETLHSGTEGYHMARTQIIATMALISALSSSNAVTNEAFEAAMAQINASLVEIAAQIDKLKPH